jgi:hypothetical protein
VILYVGGVVADGGVPGDGDGLAGELEGMARSAALAVRTATPEARLIRRSARGNGLG